MSIGGNIHKDSWGKSIFNYGKWYFLSSILTKGLSILLLPLYTRYLNPTDYGVLQSLNSVALFLPVILSLSLDSAFGRFFHDCKYDKEKLRILFSTVFWFVVVYGCFLLFIILVTSQYWVPQLLTIPIFPYVYLAFIPALLTQLSQLGRVFLEQSLQARITTLLDVVSAFLNAGLSVWLLVSFDMGVTGRLIGIAIAAIVLLVFYVIYFWKLEYLRFIFSKDVCVRSLIYAAPLVPALAGSWIAGLSDRLVIAKYCTMADVGLYSLAFQLAMVLYLVGDAVTRVLSPISMSGLVYDKENTKHKMANGALYLWGIMLWANIGISLFAKEVVALISDKAFHSSYSLIAIISFIYVLGMQYRFSVDIISFHKKTWILTIASVLMGVLNLVLNLWLVPIYGYFASAWATVISMLIYTVWIIAWGQSLDRLPYKWKKYFFCFMVFVLSLYFTSILIDDTEKWSLFLLLKKILLYCIVTVLMTIPVCGSFKTFIKIVISKH